MKTPKLVTIIQIVTDHLRRRRIPWALIGALARSAYGLPRYTSDIDLLSDGRHANRISEVMAGLGYQTLQLTEAFAQFTSEMNVLGKIHFLFVRTPDGIRILEDRARITDETLGEIDVVQPTDYLVLKLMAVANNPSRRAGDEADMVSLLKAWKGGQLPDAYEAIDTARLLTMADRFRQRALMESILAEVRQWTEENGEHSL